MEFDMSVEEFDEIVREEQLSDGEKFRFITDNADDNAIRVSASVESRGEDFAVRIEGIVVGWFGANSGCAFRPMVLDETEAEILLEKGVALTRVEGTNNLYRILVFDA